MGFRGWPEIENKYASITLTQANNNYRLMDESSALAPTPWSQDTLLPRRSRGLADLIGGVGQLLEVILDRVVISTGDAVFGHGVLGV
mgnify:CR=1 FL=1